ncbi:hypothetical protein ACFL6I_10000 [candidate division KSB1 bacterium]
MKLISLITLLFLIISTPVFAVVDTTHVGFVDSSIWFDREPFFSGKEVRVYTTLANSSNADFKGTVEFYDGETVIGNAQVTLERNGGFQVVWTDWVPEEGNHSVSVKITEASLTPAGGESEVVEYNNVPTILDRFIDTDTDEDGIGNKEDTDDDNDGIPDIEDTEPLVKAVEFSGDAPLSVKENLEDKSTQVISKVGEFASSTSPKIVAGVEKAIDVVEEFRVAQSKNVDEKIKQIKQKINEDQAGFENAPVTEDSGNEKKNAPFNQLQLLALTTAGYTLSHKIAFYITGIFVLYFLIRKIIPWMWRLIRSKDEF